MTPRARGYLWVFVLLPAAVGAIVFVAGVFLGWW